MKKLILKIEGMHCSSCAMNIDFDLEDLNGVASATTNYAKGECEVEFDENILSVDKIIKQIQLTGYTAKVENEINE